MQFLKRTFVFSFFVLSLSSTFAQSPVQQLIPQLKPVAEGARQAVVDHPSLAAFEIGAMIKDAISKAQTVYKETNDVQAARQSLLGLEKDLGPLKEIPSFDLHLLLGSLAGSERNLADQTYHRAYGVALMMSLDKTGNALSLETAPKIVLVQEEYNWFFLRRDILERVSRVSKRENGKLYDIWQAKKKDGSNLTVYFDASEMEESYARKWCTT